MITQDNIEKMLNKKFMTSIQFTNTIETIVKSSNFKLNYIDAIVGFCESQDIEIESVAKLISKPLKDKIESDAMKLNYIARKSQGVLNL